MYNRFAKTKIEEALADACVVLISGPRQSGKTTLAADIAAETIPFFTLDDATVLAAANDDPVGFLRGLKRAVIDETQRPPGVFVMHQVRGRQGHEPGPVPIERFRKPDGRPERFRFTCRQDGSEQAPASLSIGDPG